MQSEFCLRAETVSFSNMIAHLISGGQASPVTVMDISIHQNGGAPLHKSLDEEKIFTLIDGELDFTLMRATRTLRPGDRVTVARGDVHGFVNRKGDVARLLLVSAPSRHDAFFRAMAALPVPHAPEAVSEVCAKYRQEIVGL
ncbi:quercetin dioxygenase-like cupin family protein [Rhodanobacter sp. ANJX3]|jgi:quercetin dioxygenase-like cupin family protein|uniref:cupin domain-containing protein n=1 Tax=Rhodanobacter sp. ANJX3 TaxID=2723083 RepID=UPI001622E239|nr:cupin domain-containing protein [Rhodanobacter sp. ANJX3]MBB5360015.1 quercetin dioxygenase-like cupin family protein [Rhodanobacter sp. ANJX3]